MARPKKKLRFPYELNRREYNIIKKMDHLQMTMWANEIYEKGARTVKGLTPDEMRERLSEIKGLGEVKIGKIIEALSQEERG